MLTKGKKKVEKQVRTQDFDRLWLRLYKDQSMSMICILLVTLLVVLFNVVQWKNKNKKKLPPGPIGFPLFGSLHLLGKFPHHDFQKLARKYGPIMHLRLGLVPTIIVSTPQAAELFLKTHDLVFASRPPLEAIKNISWDQKSMIFSPYGSYWRDMRKMCTLELLSSAKISSFMATRREELGHLIELIREAAIGCNVIDLSAKTAELITNITCRMVFGKKYLDTEFSERGFKAIMHEGSQLSAAPNLGDYIPFLAPFDIQGLAKQFNELRRIYDEFFDKIIDEHVCSKDEDGNTKDFVDVMLSFLGSQQSEYQIERDNIKALMLDILSASMDTSATAIEWTMAELIKNPRILKTLQKELETVVGLNRVVEESDLENLEYLDMVVKETLRLHPVVPLLFHHSAFEECTVNGFHIPHKSRVFVNVYAIGRDPNIWSDPETFVPERFIGSNVDVRGKDFQLLPFGAGRRGCPGMQLGLVIVKLCVAQFVHCFDWKLLNGMTCSELDMEEEFSLTISRANHLLLVPTFRLQK